VFIFGKKNGMKTFHKFIIAFCFIAVNLTPWKESYGQGKAQMVRLARIVVDSAQLDQYKSILKEEAEASVRLEPGVITLYAVSETNNPTHFTILEIYADSAAYRSHLQTPHFLKYKTGTKDMIKSLELIETTPLIPDMKIKSPTVAVKRKK
jgi:quinol monooxygenase YgiN